MEIAKKQTATSGDYERLEGGDKDKKCGDSTPFGANETGNLTLSQCVAACTAKKYVTFWTGYAKTSINVITVKTDGGGAVEYDAVTGLAKTTTASASVYDYATWTTAW